MELYHRKQRKIVFDGQVYAQRITGQYRYADEMLKAFDKIVEKNKYEIVVPKYVNIDSKFKNIRVVHFGKIKGILWSQLDLPRYLIKENAIAFGFCNVTPLVRPGIAVVHDIGYKVLSDQYKNLYGRLSAMWHRLNYWVIAHSNMPIVTVSDFSKCQIANVYNVNIGRLTVIGNAWNHFNSINYDDTVFERLGIKKNDYYFSLGSLEERKNFNWIIEVAKRNPVETFVIAGGAVKNNKHKLNVDALNNVNLIGYITDNEIKSLMKYSKAFIFPSTFEGFGVPPLEALSVGCNVLCADCASIPEICEDAVTYMAPFDYDFNLNSIETKPRESVEKVLDKYVWDISAKKLFDLLGDINRDFVSRKV